MSYLVAERFLSTTLRSQYYKNILRDFFCYKTFCGDFQAWSALGIFGFCQSLQLLQSLVDYFRRFLKPR
jgi:hypothetical protein